MCREPLQGLHECSPFLCLLVLDRWIGAHRDNVALETPSERRVGHLLAVMLLLHVTFRSRMQGGEGVCSSRPSS